MLIDTRPLDKLVESATLRLDEIRNSTQRLEAEISPEIGCLYRLFLMLAAEVKKLQVESNKTYGG